MVNPGVMGWERGGGQGLLTLPSFDQSFIGLHLYLASLFSFCLKFLMKCKLSVSGESGESFFFFNFVINKFAHEVMAEQLSGLSHVVFLSKEKGTADVLGTFEILISKNIGVSL